MPADVSECSSILPEREKRNLSTPEVERFFKHPYKNLNPSMVLGRWSCGTCLSASGASGFAANWRCIKPRLQIAPLSTPSASDISRHDRSCLYFDFKNQNVVLGRT
ncbi:hypothetical protein V1477_020192 [Vespula maculifrons]|uniref:Uncharacterized protein n=1 Tax=Vespula maculifrons TaxID=7453 RepID=A0ABD2AM19_VESMC